MASVQELDTKVRVLEDKVDFLLNAIRIGRASSLVGMPPVVVSMLDLYQESKAAGLTIAPPSVEDESGK